MADKKWALTTGTPSGYLDTYTDIQTWSAAEAYDLTTPGDSVYLECFDDWATGLEQNGSQIRDSHGWVTDTTNYITVKAADGEGHGGAVGGGFFINTGFTDGAIVPVGIDYVFEGLEIVASSTYCVNVSYANDSTVNVIDKCILSGSTSRSIGQNTGYTLLTNSLIIDGSDRGVDNVLTINCTIDNFPNDYAALARNLAWRNVVVTNSYGANDPWYQDGSVDYCATDYSSGVAGSNSVTLTADPYNDRASNDYSISNTSELYDAGVDLTSTYPQLAYDIAGNPRSSTYSIGAYEYVSGAAGVTETLSEAATTGASLAETWSVDYAETASASATTAASTVEAWSLSYSETLAESATTVVATADAWSVEYAETLAEAAATAASLSESYDLGAAYQEALAQSASTAATLAETYGAPDYAETLSESATTAASLTDTYELGQAYQESLAQSAATASATAEAYTAPGFDEALAEAASTGALMSASYDAPDYSETASESATTAVSTLEAFGFLEEINEAVTSAIAAAEAYDAPDYSEAFNAAAAATATTAETFSTPNVLPAIVRLEARLLQGYRIAARLEGYEIAAKM